MRLQVRLNEQWEYVFCREVSRREPITTKNPSRALGADALAYFERNFADHEFRIVRNHRKER